MSISPLNTTVTAANYTMKTFYERELLEIAKTITVLEQLGMQVSIAKRNGKTIEWRKSVAYTPSTTALLLSEGVTPTGQTYAQTQVLATLYTYGAFVGLTTELVDTALDAMVSENNTLLSQQLATTLEWLIRDAIIGEATAQYAGSNTTMLGVDKTDLLSVDEIRKAKMFLDKQKAPKFTMAGGPPHYVCVTGPDAIYDLEEDDKWQKPQEYQGTPELYSGELGMLYGVRFIQSTETKQTAQSVNDFVNADTTTSPNFVIKGTPSTAAIAYLSTAGNKIKIGADIAHLTEYEIASYTSATKTVTLTTSPSLTHDHLVVSEDAGTLQSDGTGVTMHHSLVLAKDAFGVVKLAGEGTLQSIYKPKGSEGSGDPLDQRLSVAVKCPYFAAKLLYPLYAVDIIHAATNTNP